MIKGPTRDDPNYHIVAYLREYCKPENDADYAVMLRGAWGSGKTHLVEAFLSARKEEGSPKHLYVSLYGVSTVRQIDEALTRQLHPRSEERRVGKECQ